MEAKAAGASGSVWNKGGNTWEEKPINTWAHEWLKESLSEMAYELPGAGAVPAVPKGDEGAVLSVRARVATVESVSGEATFVVSRGKQRACTHLILPARCAPAASPAPPAALPSGFTCGHDGVDQRARGRPAGACVCACVCVLCCAGVVFELAIKLQLEMEVRGSPRARTAHCRAGGGNGTSAPRCKRCAWVPTPAQQPRAPMAVHARAHGRARASRAHDVFRRSPARTLGSALRSTPTAA